jgi:hypothetical protein
MNPYNSHTHCQVAPAVPQAKTWQRVSVPTRNRQTIRTKKEHRSDNITYTQWGFTCGATSWCASIEV